MIHDSKLIQLNEKAAIIQLLHDNKIRVVLTEILSEITSPRRINNIECLRLIADILRFVLTLFVHEQDADYRLLAVILDCSQHLYYLNNKRKQSMAYYLLDHGIWSDTGAWRECIEATLRYKMSEQAQRMKKRESRVRSLANERRKSMKEETQEVQSKGAVVVKAGANALKKGFTNINGKFKGMMKTKE